MAHTPPHARAMTPGEVTEALPTYWRSHVADGSSTYPDDPEIAMPAGVYLVGGDSATFDPDSDRIVARLDLVRCEEPEGDDLDQAAVGQALAEHLNELAQLRLPRGHVFPTRPSGPSGAAHDEAVLTDLSVVLNMHSVDARLGFHDYVLAAAALRHIQGIARTRDAERVACGPRADG